MRYVNALQVRCGHIRNSQGEYLPLSSGTEMINLDDMISRCVNVFGGGILGNGVFLKMPNCGRYDISGDVLAGTLDGTYKAGRSRELF